MSALDALQTTLAAEHAAVFLYGLYGGRTSQSADPGLYAAVEAGYRAHRARRDQLRLAIADLGGEPVAAAATYEVPRNLVVATRIKRAALETERACQETYAAQVAQTVGGLRRWAATALAEAALQALAVGGRPEPFPGAPELG
ncbi:DUF4439 domain-containing protein [Nocardioides gansuensis]|uniref:DUF4439 domain-containing protein n=1 Tax=Nocardioides gansuensis TaxID=2138300 RepID=A0A2T8FAI0_9ACTN|nr:DUF4439 domain-containing protein [Nocardioides gansuensis]PVG82685.1 DUF4439 domain-containing protein [Nocardioides gansuensis]